MRNILIFYQNKGSSGAFGVGTFVNLFKYIFPIDHYKIYLIQLHSNVLEFSIFEHKNHTHIKIPKCDLSNDCLHEKNIINILFMYVKNNKKPIIFFNYETKIPEVIKREKREFYMIRIIHSFPWVWPVNGNEMLFKKYIKNKSKNNRTSEFVYNRFENEKKHLLYFDKLIPLSPDSSTILSSIYGIDCSKIAMISNGVRDRYRVISLVQKHKLREELGVNKDEKILLYVGRFDSLKGISILISSFNKIILQRKDCRLVIVGEGEFGVVSDFIYKAAMQITFTGKISSGELVKWYRIADMGILPTFSEECSFVGIEMMMHGLPIVSTNGRGVRNMFHHLQNSFIVNCQGGRALFEKELLEAIVKILDSENLSNELRRQSRKWYLENYHFSIMKKKYLSLIKGLG